MEKLPDDKTCEILVEVTDICYHPFIGLYKQSRFSPVTDGLVINLAYMKGPTGPGTLHAASVNSHNKFERCYYYSSFTDEKLKAQKSQMTCLTHNNSQ